MLKRIEGQHLLLDTNILIKLSQDLEKGHLKGFLKSLKELNVKSAIEGGTLFEFW
jgi:hypothetical protein